MCFSYLDWNWFCELYVFFVLCMKWSNICQRIYSLDLCILILFISTEFKSFKCANEFSFINSNQLCIYHGNTIVEYHHFIFKTFSERTLIIKKWNKLKCVNGKNEKNQKYCSLFVTPATTNLQQIIYSTVHGIFH